MQTDIEISKIRERAILLEAQNRVLSAQNATYRYLDRGLLLYLADKIKKNPEDSRQIDMVEGSIEYFAWIQAGKPDEIR